MISLNTLSFCRQPIVETGEAEQLSAGMHEGKFGIDWEPYQFIEKAIEVGHPFSQTKVLHKELVSVVEEHCTLDWEAINYRRQTFCKK